MSRTILVEIRMSVPQGESIDDWGHVGHYYMDLEEDRPQADQQLTEIKNKIWFESREWLKTHPEKEA